MVVEVTYLTWTDDNLLRHVVFNGVREDKPARDVVRPIPHPEKVPTRQERAAAAEAAPKGSTRVDGANAPHSYRRKPPF